MQTKIHRNEILANCKTDEERAKTAEFIRPCFLNQAIHFQQFFVGL